MPIYTRRDLAPIDSSSYGNSNAFAISSTALAAVAVLVAILTLLKKWKMWTYFRRRRWGNKKTSAVDLVRIFDSREGHDESDAYKLVM